MSVPSDKLKLMIQSYSTPKKEHQPIFSAPNNVSKNKQSVQFKDNRPDATTQLKVQQIANQPIQRQENKTGMPDNLKSGIENLSGMDMRDVKVHYNSALPAQLQAHAFAQGNQIHIASGQERHLPHEAWHVVQQKQGRVAPTKQLKGKVNINDDTGLEKEADVMGAKAMNMSGTNTNFPSFLKENTVTTTIQRLAWDKVNTGSTYVVRVPYEGEKVLKLQSKRSARINATGRPSFIFVDPIDRSVPPITIESEEDILREAPSAHRRLRTESPELIGRGVSSASRVEEEETYPFREDSTVIGHNVLLGTKVVSRSKKLFTIIKIDTFRGKTVYTLKDNGGNEPIVDYDNPNFQLLNESDRLPPPLKEQILSKTDTHEVNRTVVTQWCDDIENKNEKVLRIFNKDTTTEDVTQHPWFLMDYEDIVDSQAEEAGKVIKDSVLELIPDQRNNLHIVAPKIREDLAKHYLPLVVLHNIQLDSLEEREAVRVDYSINPSYKKYIDTGSGNEAVNILGDSVDNKVKTDIRFLPGSLTLGDQTSQVGKAMEAKTLSKDHPIGSIAGKDSSQEGLMGNLVKTMGDKKTKYIKGHLLNDHIGGPARAYNLFPITEQANNDHLVFMEKYVKAEVAKGYVMYYKVLITNESIKDEKPLQVGYKRRYTVNSDIKCWSAKIKKDGDYTDQHNITVKSIWQGGEVLDSTGTRIRRKSDTSGIGNPLDTYAAYTGKLKTGIPNEAGENPDVKAPDASIHRIFNIAGYNQDDMHKGKLSDSDFDSTTIGPIPFSISGDKGKLSDATQASVATAVGTHIAGLIWGNASVKDSTTGKIKAGITELGLRAIKGVGPATVEKLKNNFEIQ